MAEDKKVVVMETTAGTIELTLYPDKAPDTVENFIKYSKDGHYNGTIFHRVIDGFMIQGGGMTASMQEKKTRAPIRNEADNGLKNTRGAISMARTSEVDSATSQFFINVNDNDFLNFRDKTPSGYGYAVFGEVTKGMDVVDKIKSVKTGMKPPHDDVPLEPIEIQSVKVVQE